MLSRQVQNYYRRNTRSNWQADWWMTWKFLEGMQWGRWCSRSTCRQTPSVASRSLLSITQPLDTVITSLLTLDNTAWPLATPSGHSSSLHSPQVSSSSVVKLLQPRCRSLLSPHPFCGKAAPSKTSYKLYQCRLGLQPRTIFCVHF